MIFVTVGNHSQGFDRLIQKMDEVAIDLDEKVVMQTGTATYEPKNVEHFSASTRPFGFQLCTICLGKEGD